MSKLITGADLKLFINGTLLAECTGIEHSIDYAQKEISGIDSLLPFEIAPGMVRVSGSISFYRLRGTGGLEGKGIVAAFNNLANGKYITFQLLDRNYQQVILTVQRATVRNQKARVGQKQVVTGSFNFVGIIAGNELF